jgi:N-acetylmuramic acid 6-phosphate etherase
MLKTTESESKYNHLEKMSINNLLTNINKEDKTVPFAIEKIIPQIETLVNVIVKKMRKGGRLFYMGAGTSGRLGIVDASELPPTFGLEHGKVIGIIAGGDSAIRKAVEFAEDDREQGWKDLQTFKINKNDIVIGIAASGTTPYIIGALEKCQEHGIITGSISCNKNAKVSEYSDFPIEVIVGPEFITGSTRMKAGTAQKLVLNMISTTVMIQMGRIKGNKMVDMQLSNNKLIHRGTKMLMKALSINEKEAAKLLSKHGSVRKAMENNIKNNE